MKYELVSLSNAIRELAKDGRSKDEALIEIIHHIRKKSLIAYATDKGFIIIDQLERRRAGNYFIKTSEPYSIEGYLTPCELPVLDVVHSIHLIKQQFIDLFKISQVKAVEVVVDNDTAKIVLTDEEKKQRAGFATPSPMPPKEALKILKIARGSIKNGKSAKPDEIYNWLVKESEASDCDEVFERLDFYDEKGNRVSHYGESDNKKAVRGEVVLIWDGAPKKGATFENWCSASKKVN